MGLEPTISALATLFPTIGIRSQVPGSGPARLEVHATLPSGYFISPAKFLL